MTAEEKLREPYKEQELFVARLKDITTIDLEVPGCINEVPDALPVHIS